MDGTAAQMRSDPAIAGAVLRAVFKDAPGHAMASCLAFLIEVIDHLSSIHRDRWEISLFDWGLRLNVGWVECFVLHAEGARVLLKKDVAPGDTKFDGVTYKHAIGCDMSTLPLALLPQSLPFLTEAFHAAIAIVAKAKAPLRIRSAHSAGVTRFLAEYAHRTVANPSYFLDADWSAWEGRDEQSTHQIFAEGARVPVMVNRFERDISARQACVAHYGLRCSVCEMTFLDRYGETMKNLIHVHHIVPLSSIGGRYHVDPIADLRPVCPNCHAAIHREDPPLTIGEARKLLSSGQANEAARAYCDFSEAVSAKSPQR